MSQIDEKLIARINELARKKKEIGLSAEEIEEQKDLRAIYIKEFRKGFESQLKTIKVVDPMGNDVTPKKLKAEKSKN